MIDDGVGGYQECRPLLESKKVPLRIAPAPVPRTYTMCRWSLFGSGEDFSRPAEGARTKTFGGSGSWVARNLSNIKHELFRHLKNFKKHFSWTYDSIE